MLGAKELPPVPADLPPRPPRWRTLLPAWFRALVWVDEATSFDGFLSYSWKADSRVAPLIQSVLQNFLRPWYKLRALRIFRDLSSLAAASSLSEALQEQLNKSRHLIVLACEEAATSAGMEFEAAYWFSRPREGQVIIVITAGNFTSWEEIRERALPSTLRKQLTSQPLWIDVSRRRSEILRSETSQPLRAKLIEDLKQLILRFYPGRDWGELRGEERSQRRRALGLLLALTFLILILACTAMWQGWKATLERREAEKQRDYAIARQLAVEARRLVQQDNPELREKGLLLALEGAGRAQIPETYDAITRLLPVTPVSRINVPGTTTAAAFSPDGALLGIGTEDGRLVIWDQIRHAFAGDFQVGKSVRSIRFFHDRKRVAVGTFESRGAHILSIGDGHELWSGSTPIELFSLDLSLDDRFIVAGDYHGNATLWDLSAEMPELRLHASGNPVFAFSPDSKHLIFTIADESSTNSLAVLDVFGHTIRPIPETRGQITAVSISLNGKWVAIGEEARRVRVLDLLTGKTIHEFNDRYSSGITALAFSPDGNNLAYGDENGTVLTSDAYYWHIPIEGAGKRELRHNHEISALTFSPDGTRLLSASDSDVVRLWAANSFPQGWRRYLAGMAISEVSCSADGRLVAIVQAEGGPGTGFPPNSTIRLFDTLQNEEISSVDSYRQARSVGISSDGRWLAVGTKDGFLHVRNLGTKRPLLDHKYDASVNSVAWCCAGTLLATGDGNGDVNVWDSMIGRTRHSFTLNHPVYSVHLSQSGKWLVAAGNGVSRLWNLSSDTSVALENSERVSQVRISPDERYVAGAEEGGLIRVWDARTGRQISQAPLYSQIWGLDFSAADRLYAAGGNEIVLLSVPDGRVLIRNQSRAAVRTMTLAEQKALIIVGTSLGELEQISIPSFEYLREQACGQINRELKLEEWRDYLDDLPYRKQCPSRKLDKALP